MAIDSRAFRDALGRFATGVTIITTTHRGMPAGITANSFTSVSLDPPLVLFCLGRDSNSFDAFMASDCFAAHVLGLDQQHLSVRFADQEADRFAGLETGRWETGAPIIPGVVAAMDCRHHATHDAGDHVIMVGLVKRFAVLTDTPPLLFFRGGYRELA